MITIIYFYLESMTNCSNYVMNKHYTMMNELKTMISTVLDIKYNVENFNFWYDRILKITYSTLKNEYIIKLINDSKHKQKTVHLSNHEIQNYILKYEA